MNVTVINSKFSSLSFRNDWQAFFDTESCYIQKFAIGEEIRIQFVSELSGFETKYFNENETPTAVPVNQILSLDGKFIYETLFSIQTPGIYRFELTSGLADPIGAYFSIEKPENLKHTILLSYTHRKNEFDTLFEGRVFNFRIEGGIYPGETKQAIENEIFRDQRLNPIQLSAIPYEVKTLIIGSTEGVPQWTGNKINHILSLSEVTIDGIETVRNESSVPELISLGEKNPLYVHKISIEQPDEDIHVGIDYYEYLTDNTGNKITDNNGNYIKVRREKQWQI
jgi:hypothetical protein